MTMIHVIAAEIGALALWLTYIWLASSIIASYLSNRKGYGERKGLATGLLLSAAAVVIWLVWPARKESRWKLQGPFPWQHGKTVAEAKAQASSDDSAESTSG